MVRIVDIAKKTKALRPTVSPILNGNKNKYKFLPETVSICIYYSDFNTTSEKLVDGNSRCLPV
jgi:hypothetical protein